MKSSFLQGLNWIFRFFGVGLLFVSPVLAMLNDRNQDFASKVFMIGLVATLFSLLIELTDSRIPKLTFYSLMFIQPWYLAASMLIAPAAGVRVNLKQVSFTNWDSFLCAAAVISISKGFISISTMNMEMGFRGALSREWNCIGVSSVVSSLVLLVVLLTKCAMALGAVEYNQRSDVFESLADSATFATCYLALTILHLIARSSHERWTTDKQGT
jgi:hypothetical protein